MRGSLADLAAMPGMPSEPTLRKLIAEHPGFPILARGRNGVSYEFELPDAFAFVRGIEEEKRQAAAAHNEAVRQLGLELLGPDAAAPQQDVALGAEARRALLEEEMAAIRVAEKRRHLVRKSSVEAALANFVLAVAQRLDTLPDRLAKRADVPRDTILALERMIEADRREIAAQMEQMRDAAPVDQDADPAI